MKKLFSSWKFYVVVIAIGFVLWAVPELFAKGFTTCFIKVITLLLLMAIAGKRKGLFQSQTMIVKNVPLGYKAGNLCGK